MCCQGNPHLGTFSGLRAFMDCGLLYSLVEKGPRLGKMPFPHNPEGGVPIASSLPVPSPLPLAGPWESTLCPPRSSPFLQCGGSEATQQSWMVSSGLLQHWTWASPREEHANSLVEAHTPWCGALASPGHLVSTLWSVCSMSSLYSPLVRSIS